MMFPKRRKPPRSGIERAPQREWPKHRKWVRGFECACKVSDHLGPIVFAHVRTGTDGGTSRKPSDWWGIPLCMGHHDIQHNFGEEMFERRYGIDMKAIARSLAERSPDLKMREAMRAALSGGGK